MRAALLLLCLAACADDRGASPSAVKSTPTVVEPGPSGASAAKKPMASATHTATAASAQTVDAPAAVNPDRPPPPDPSAARRALARGLLIVMPPSVDEPVPFILFLHGENDTGAKFVRDLGVEQIVADRPFAFAAPNAPKDAKGRAVWRASHASWGAGEPSAEQDEDLAETLELAWRKPNIDKKRMFVVGFGAGGFLAHRLACDTPGLRGVFSLAGAGPAEGDATCHPPGPRSVIEIHGDADKIVPFAGGSIEQTPPLPPFPGARVTFTAWGERQHCGHDRLKGALEIFGDLDGAETSVTVLDECPTDAAVELWTVHGGTHGLVTPNVLRAILNVIDRSRHE